MLKWIQIMGQINTLFFTYGNCLGRILHSLSSLLVVSSISFSILKQMKLVNQVNGQFCPTLRLFATVTQYKVFLMKLWRPLSFVPFLSFPHSAESLSRPPEFLPRGAIWSHRSETLWLYFNNQFPFSLHCLCYNVLSGVYWIQSSISTLLRCYCSRAESG